MATRRAGSATALLLCMAAAATSAAIAQKIPVVASAPQFNATSAPSARKSSFGNVNASIAPSRALAALLQSAPGMAPLPVQQAFTATTSGKVVDLNGGSQQVRLNSLIDLIWGVVNRHYSCSAECSGCFAAVSEFPPVAVSKFEQRALFRDAPSRQNF